MNVHEAMVRGSIHKGALGIGGQPFWPDRPFSREERIRIGSSIDESSNSVAGTNQQRAAIIFDKTLHAVVFAWHRMEFWRIGFPSPDAVRDGRPESALG